MQSDEHGGMKPDGLARRDGRDQLDLRIDAALHSYAESPQFQDARIALACVRELAEQLPPRHGWRVWAWAIPAGAVALIALAALNWFVGIGPPPRVAWPRTPAVASVPGDNGSACCNVQRANTAPSERLPRNRTRGASAHGDRALEATARPLPKQEVFPTPSLLSAQERALLAFATQAPPDVKKQVIEAQKHLGDPIEIATLKIRPLDEDERQTNQ